jgi:hypothetical protein
MQVPARRPSRNRQPFVSMTIRFANHFVLGPAKKQSPGFECDHVVAPPAAK